MSTLFYVDTLSSCAAAAGSGRVRLLGTALAVKPILHVVDGEAYCGRRCARPPGPGPPRRLIVEDGRLNVDIAVQHLDAADRAQALRPAAGPARFRVRRSYISEVGAGWPPTPTRRDRRLHPH
jgi:hypothetical protein